MVTKKGGGQELEDRAKNNIDFIAAAKGYGPLSPVFNNENPLKELL